MPSMILKVSSYLIMMSMSIQLIMPELEQASVNAAYSARDIGVSVNTKLFCALTQAVTLMVTQLLQLFCSH